MHVDRNGGDDLEVTVLVRNRGRRRGKEVVQLYVGSEDPGRPPLELRAFERIELDAGGEATVTFTLGERAFSRWDSDSGRFALVPGTHEIAVGRSSRDLRLRKNVALGSELVEKPAAGRAARFS